MSYRTVILGGAAAFFVCCLLRVGFRANPPSVSNAPLTCDVVVHDFGTKPTGDSVVHVFLLRNTGDRDLEIAEVRPGCSCTTTELSEKVIQPGGSVSLKVMVSLENLRGPVEQHIVVKSNDPAPAILLLRTKGLVESAFSMKPHVIDFGKVAQGEQLESRVNIDATGSGSFVLLAVACDSPLCRVSQETVEEGKSYRVSVRTIGKLPLGFWRTAIRIRTDNPKESQIVLPVVARVEARPATAKEN